MSSGGEDLTIRKIFFNFLQLLHYKRCEFLLVGAITDTEEELGASALEITGAVEKRICPSLSEECLLEDLKKEIGADDLGLDTEPAGEGEWD